MANTVFKVDHGLLAAGNSAFLANVTISNTSILTANTVLPVSAGSPLGLTSQRWSLAATTGDFSTTVAIAGNVAVNTSVLVVHSNTTVVRVGVNTATPDATFAVVGTANVSGNVAVGGTISASGNAGFGTNTLMVYPSTGMVRINTTDVANTLAAVQIAGNTYIAANTTVAGKLTVDSIYCDGDFTVGGSLSYTGTSQADIIPASTAYSLGSATDPTLRWGLFATSGSFDNDLTVRGSLQLTNATATHAVNGNVNFDTGTLFIDSTNNRVGISNTAPNETFVVAGTANVAGNTALSGVLRVTSNATVQQANVGGTLVVSGNVAVNTNALVVTSTGSTVRVGVATSSPGQTLSVEGTLGVTGAATFDGQVSANGNLRVGNTTSFILAKATGALQITKEIEIGNTSVYSNTQNMTTSSANTKIDSFVLSEYDASKYILSYHSTSNTQVFGATEFLVVHNGAAVLMTEYGTIYNANIEFSIDASIEQANCNIYASANTGNLIVTMTRISML